MSNPLCVSWIRPYALDHPEEIKSWRVKEWNDGGRFVAVIFGISPETGEFLKKAFLACYNPAGYDSYASNAVIDGEKCVSFVRWSCE